MEKEYLKLTAYEVGLVFGLLDRDKITKGLDIKINDALVKIYLDQKSVEPIHLFPTPEHLKEFTKRNPEITGIKVDWPKEEKPKALPAEK